MTMAEPFSMHDMTEEEKQIVLEDDILMFKMIMTYLVEEAAKRKGKRHLTVLVLGAHAELLLLVEDGTMEESLQEWTFWQGDCGRRETWWRGGRAPGG